MRFIIRDDAEQASIYVASYIVDRIKHFNPTPSNPFVLGLPTGSSPLGVYRILVEKFKAGEVSPPEDDATCQKQQQHKARLTRLASCTDIL